MKRVAMTLCFGMLLSLVLILGGCQTMGSNKEMQTRKYSRIAELNRRMMAEDIEAFWLLDQPSSLSRWQVMKN